MRRKRLKRLIQASGIVLMILGVVAWLSFEHIPTWYQPLWLSSAEIEAVRTQAEQSFESITRQMVAGAPFNVTLTGRQINEILSAQEAVWPGAARKLRSYVSGAWVGLESNEVRVGMRCRWGQVESILSVRLNPRLEDGRPAVRVLSFQAGSLPFPSTMIGRLLEVRRDLSGPALATPPSRLDWREALRSLLTRGEYEAETDVLWWPNGEVPFRIAQLEITPELINVGIVPLLSPRHAGFSGKETPRNP